MKRTSTKLMAALALLVGLAIPMGMWGQTVVTFTPGTDKGATSVTKGAITATMTTMNNDEYYQIYANESGTFSTSDGKITKVVFTCTASGTDKYGPGNASANVGDYSYEGTVGTWTGEATSITISTTKQIRMTSLEVTYTPSGGGDLQDNDLAVSPTSLALDMHNNPNTGTITCTTSSTGAISVSENDYVTTSVSGNTITVTPVAITPSAQTITVSQAADDTYAAGSATFTVTVANTTPTVNVTYLANGGVGDDIVETPYQGSDYTVAANTFSYTGHSFTKWNTVAGGTGQDYDPNDVINNIQNNIDLYAQWEEVNEVVDVIDRAFTGISGGSGYGNWSGKTGTSGAVYAGNSAGGSSTSNPSIQLRSSNSNSGIVSTKSGGKVTQVEVTWNSSTSSGRKLDIYGKNSAYSAATDLYGDNAGTLIGSITCGNNNSTVLTINSDYTFIGMRSNSNAIYLDEIQITWEPVSSDVVATPVINPNGGSFWESQEVSITCATDDATIYYTTNGDDPTNESEVYNAPFTITATNTVKAFAVKADMTDSEIATAEFTKATAMTVAQALAVTPPQNGVYVGGIISDITEVSTQYHNASYKISDDGTHHSELTVFRGKYLNGANFTSEDQIQVGDVVVVYGDLGTYNEAIQLNQNNYLVSLVRPEKAATPTFSPAAGTYYAAQNVTISCETDGATIYYTIDGSNPTTESSVYSEAIAVSESTTIKAFAVVDGKDDSDIATAAYIIDLTPTITVSPATATPSASDTDGTLDLTYANLTITDKEDFDIQYCDAEGAQAEQPDWIEVLVAEQDPTIGEGYVVSYIMDENTVAEARTAYFKVYAMDGEEFVYSNLVTVTQAAFVIDYATLPFEWAGGPKSTFNALTGVTTYGLGSDYADSNAPYLIKLDTDGDYIQIKTNEQPGKVTIGVKMLGGTNTSTITVQGSADGQTFADVEDLTISGTSNTTKLTIETTNDFASTDRYVRLLFTKGSNVGVGPITIAQVDNTPSITLSTYEVNVDAADHDGTINVTYKNVEVDQTSIYFCDANGDAATYGDWIQVAINSTNNNVDYVIGSNTGEARTAYFKVYSMDAGTNLVYSDIVTVTQAAPAPTYTVNFELDGGTFVPNDVFTEDIVEVEAGTYALPSATKDGNSFAGWKLAGTETTYAAGENFEVNADVSFTAQWTAVITYSLVTSMNQIVSGKHYIIASGTSTSTNVKAMGAQNANNRSSVAVTFTGDKIKETKNVREVIINGPDKDGHYIIYDPIADGSYEAGYLYAAGTSSSTNYLKKQSFNDNRGVWTISINNNDNDNAAVITSLTDKTDRNTIRYNSSSSGGIFSCYGSTNQAVVYLYVKDVNPSYDYYKDIAAYTGTNDNYRLIASPVAANPAEVTGMTDGTFDLYYFDQAEEEEWRNYEAENGEFNLVPGKGYLYANNADVTLHFNGTPAEEPTVTLAKSGNGIWKGWNLVGNPFGHIAYIIKDYYRMNAAGNEIELGQGAINPMEGVFVVANENEEVMTFYPTQPLTMNNDVVVNITNGNNVIDRAIVRFGEGRQLPKFQLNPNHTKVYFSQGNEDYAVVRSANEGEMPVSFKAETRGTYTLSVNAENVEMTYLHLIDNKTGNDVDLLATPSYTFEANNDDYESRFRLVFKVNADVEENAATETFAYFNGSEWVISNPSTGSGDNATLQVVDMMGRVLSSETVSGNANVTLNQAAGVYVLRLINGENVKVQKVVVR